MADILRIECGVLKDCLDKGAASVAIPDGVTEIEAGAFDGCTSLSKVALGDGFEKVPSKWFDGLNDMNPNYEIVCTKGSPTYRAIKRSPKLKIHVKEIATQIAKDKKIAELQKAGAKALIGTLLERFGDSSVEVLSGTKKAAVVLVKVGRNVGVFKLGADHSRWLPKVQEVVEAFADSSKSASDIADVIKSRKLTLAGNRETESGRISLQAGANGSLRIFAYGELNKMDYGGLKSIELSGITAIGFWAFSDCTSLSSVVIPPSVVSMMNRAFANCTSLESIVLPDGFYRIGFSAFRDCTSLKSVSIPDSVGTIEPWAFKNCDIDELEHRCISIKNGICIEGGEALYCSSQNSEITIPDGVTKIAPYAFSEINSLSSVVIPDGVAQIGESAFCLCESLSAVSIPGSVTEIGEHAFSLCKSLSSVKIPGSVTKIGEGAFGLCRSLSSVEFGGTMAQWNAVKKKFWAKKTNLNSVKCTDGTISF